MRHGPMPALIVWLIKLIYYRQQQTYIRHFFSEALSSCRLPDKRECLNFHLICSTIFCATTNLKQTQTTFIRELKNVNVLFNKTKHTRLLAVIILTQTNLIKFSSLKKKKKNTIYPKENCVKLIFFRIHHIVSTRNVLTMDSLFYKRLRTFSLR